MKKAIVLLAVLALLLGSAVPSDAWRGHGHFRGGCCWGWWWPGAIIGGRSGKSDFPADPLERAVEGFHHRVDVAIGHGGVEPADGRAPVVVDAFQEHRQV